MVKLTLFLSYIIRQRLRGSVYKWRVGQPSIKSTDKRAVIVSKPFDVDACGGTLYPAKEPKCCYDDDNTNVLMISTVY